MDCISDHMVCSIAKKLHNSGGGYSQKNILDLWFIRQWFMTSDKQWMLFDCKLKMSGSNCRFRLIQRLAIKKIRPIKSRLGHLFFQFHFQLEFTTLIEGYFSFFLKEFNNFRPSINKTWLFVFTNKNFYLEISSNFFYLKYWYSLTVMS